MVTLGPWLWICLHSSKDLLGDQEGGPQPGLLCLFLVLQIVLILLTIFSCSIQMSMESLREYLADGPGWPRIVASVSAPLGKATTKQKASAVAVSAECQSSPSLEASSLSDNDQVIPDIVQCPDGDPADVVAWVGNLAINFQVQDGKDYPEGENTWKVDGGALRAHHSMHCNVCVCNTHCSLS